MVRTRTLAKYGTIASVPGGIIIGLVGLIELHYELSLSNFGSYLLGVLGILIIAVPLGAIGAIFFVKISGHIPGRSNLVKVSVFSVVVWVLVTFSSLSLPEHPTVALSGLVGFLVWAIILARYLDRDKGDRKEQQRDGASDAREP